MKKLLFLIAVLAFVSPCFAKPIRIMVYGDIANLGGAAFFDAGSVITTDGFHLTAEAEKKLGTAVAAKVKEIMK
jgi:hypothetical protein